MLPEFNRQNFVGFFDKREFVEATIGQLNKDLTGLSVDEIKSEFSADKVILDQLVAVVVVVLQTLIKRQPEQLSQFIYRVDLSEKKFVGSISRDVSLHDLAHLVIEREAQKVWLRFKFS